MGCVVDVVQVVCDLFLCWIVCCGVFGECMGDFVQQYLMDFVVVELCGEVVGDGDVFFCVVVLFGLMFGMVEVEGLVVIEMQCDQCFVLDVYLVKFCYVIRLSYVFDNWFVVWFSW